MFQYKKDYLALSFHINLCISSHLALITHDATYIMNSSIIIIIIIIIIIALYC